jgi:cbb3-type cytochrome oxidase cytochrome c subunit
MSADGDRQQAKMKEFMQLLPLTVELAGLSHAEGGRPFTDAQLEGRAMAIRAAYKVARQLVIDIARPSE